MGITIESLKEEVANKNNSVSELLRKSKIIASELHLSDFLDWIDCELNGYGEKSVPEYRIINGDPKAYNPFRGWIPFVSEDNKVQASISKRGVSQPITQLEDIISSGKNKLAIKYSPELEEKMRKAIQFETQIILQVERSEVVGIIEAVRNRLLEWLIKLEVSGVKIEDQKFSQKDIQIAKEVESSINIEHIDNFHGNISNIGAQNEIVGRIINPEGFYEKFFWYVIVALVVVIIGNIVSVLLLKIVFGIS